jgi:hypothetical protein
LFTPQRQQPRRSGLLGVFLLVFASGDKFVIDPSIEDLVPVMDSRHLFPRSRRRRGDGPDGERTLIGLAKLLKLCSRGNRQGIRLESLLISGVRYTSRQAVGRFLRATSAAEESLVDGANGAAKAVHPGPRRKRPAPR